LIYDLRLTIYDFQNAKPPEKTGGFFIFKPAGSNEKRPLPKPCSGAL